MISFNFVLYLPFNLRYRTMHHIKTSDQKQGFNATISIFSNKECHIMIEPADFRADASSSIASLEEGLENLLTSSQLSGFRPVFMRWFLSDIHAQKKLVRNNPDIPVSFIQQPPMNGSKAVLWVWLMNDVSGNYEYIFRGDMHSDAEGSYKQMDEILKEYLSLIHI